MLPRRFSQLGGWVGDRAQGTKLVVKCNARSALYASTSCRRRGPIRGILGSSHGVLWSPAIGVRGLGSVGTARSSYVGLRWRQDPFTGRTMRYPMGSGIGGRVCFDDLTLEKIPGRQRRFLDAIMRKWYGGPILLSRYTLEAVGLT